jgi:hypothetical protein
MVSLTLVLIAAPLFSYSNPIATTDDRTLFFQARTTVSADAWFRLSVESREVAPVSDPLADVNASGDILATATYGGRNCGFGGSTCFLAAPCAATFSIRGRGINSAVVRQRTFVRLDRSGQRAWIIQDMACPSLGLGAPPPLNGLYESATLSPVAAARGTVLASARHGRRLITDRGQVLTFSGPQLQWLDATGVRNVHHVNGASEAVTDAAGLNVVYIEAGSDALHWVAGFSDERLGINGTAPALTDDGTTLVFLALDGSLQLYDRSTRATRRLGSDTYSAFTLGTRAAFAITAEDRLVRLDLATGASAILLEPIPTIRAVDTSEAPVSVVCPLICYGALESQWMASAGSLLILRGERLDLTGWRARTGDFDLPLFSYSPGVAALQLPTRLMRPPDAHQIELFRPDHPIHPSFTLSLQDRMVICLATLHENYDRLVSSEDPAAVGETVHVYVTGIEEAPVLADPAATELLAFGPAQGLMATQVLDLRILRPAGQQTQLFTGITSHACTVPAAAN